MRNYIMSKVKKNKLFYRKKHIPRVSRIIPLNSVEEVNTIYGLKEVVLTKGCAVCQTIQPLGNFYAKAKNSRKNKTAEELTAKDMEWMCIVCWDDRKPKQRKEKKHKTTVVEFFKRG
jgi:hypothetical protein